MHSGAVGAEQLPVSFWKHTWKHTAACWSAPRLLTSACALQVHWKQQLLISFLLEELPRYYMLAGPSCIAGVPSPPLAQPSVTQALLIPLVAGAISWLKDRRCRQTFRKLHTDTLQAKAA